MLWASFGTLLEGASSNLCLIMPVTRRALLATSAFAALSPLAESSESSVKPMSVGVIISPGDDPAAAVKKVRDLGMNNCFLSLDHYIGDFSEARAYALGRELKRSHIQATTVEVVGPGRLIWDFLDGPSTIGLVPEATRQVRIDALKGASDFAKMLGIGNVQTHCGFIPENPKDQSYRGAVAAIGDIAKYCGKNGQNFLMETGQETPTTVLRVIRDVNLANLGVGLDTANLILYGKANPVDALDIVGPYVKSVHAKDGMWPTDPMQLGKEVPIGEGKVDFTKVMKKLQQVGYRGPITIEREISGPQQMEDIQHEKTYLEQIIAKV